MTERAIHVGRNRIEGWLGEFARGAYRPSLPALAGSVLVALALLGACTCLITPEVVGGAGRGYFVRNDEDHYAGLTAQILHLGKTARRVPSVVLIGASSTREAFSSTGELERSLLEETGEEFVVHNLTSDGITHWEAQGVWDFIGGKFPGMVVLEISPLNLSRSPADLGDMGRDWRFALDSPSFDDELRIAGVTAPRRTGNYFLDHRRFFLARPIVLLNLFRGPVTIKPHRAEEWRRLSGPEFLRAATRAGRWRETYRENREANMAVYDRIVRRMTGAEGIKVLLLDSTRNPAADALNFASDEHRALLDTYHADAAQLARSPRVDYAGLRDEAGLTPADFVDASHVNNPDGRSRYTRALAKRLAALWRDNTGTENSGP